ncbi:hypothetical protein ABRP72_14230 [Pectobacterium carotovorum]|uniref:hypothetical protein n=1 Tax=Pectobacterium carotovorum TaxID=554 RepID=UPI0032F08FDC
MKTKVNPYTLTTVTSYIFTFGILYLYGFWETININILQFVSLSEIIPLIISPSLSTIPELTLLTIGYYCLMPKIQINNNVTSNTKISWRNINYLNITIIISLVLIPSLVIIFMMYVLGKIMIITVIILISSFIIAIFIRDKTDFLSELGKGRDILLIIALFIPSMMFYKGAEDARNILNGKDTSIIKTNPSCSNDRNENFRYIATVSDKIFAISIKDGSICVLKYNYVKLEKESLPVVRTPSTINKA